jgi:hypothetical protein
MDLASKFDTGAAKAAFKKKSTYPFSGGRALGRWASDNHDEAMGILNVRQQSEKIKNSLEQQKTRWDQTTKTHAASAKATKDIAEAHRKYGTKKRTGPARKRTETERRLDKLEKEYKAGQFERDIERYK